jgi:hypothetical protein
VSFSFASEAVGSLLPVRCPLEGACLCLLASACSELIATIMPAFAAEDNPFIYSLFLTMQQTARLNFEV